MTDRGTVHTNRTAGCMHGNHQFKKRQKKRSVTPQSETLNYITATRHFWDVLTSLLHKGRRYIVHLYLCQ